MPATRARGPGSVAAGGIVMFYNPAPLDLHVAFATGDCNCIYLYEDRVGLLARIIQLQFNSAVLSRFRLSIIPELGSPASVCRPIW